jgi:hypothetical protein
MANSSLDCKLVFRLICVSLFIILHIMSLLIDYFVNEDILSCA